ncbi:hypothetical protein HWV62_31623 [Athelia sp. TMB]|nr:hypothetical protein HWV62_31623 [Athelia sp. TMB]
MATGDNPLLKRKRSQDSLEAPTLASVPVRSDVWYEDGNVVLQAEGTLFKVHKSILAESSSVFKDMFGIPQPPSTGADLIEGCPVVHLSDKADEVKYILQALCQREYASYKKKPSLAVISAFLTLGRKYDIPKLQNDGRERLYAEFPLTLKEYDAVSEVGWVAIELPESWFEVVVLARKTGLLSVLPHLLHTICEGYSASEIVAGEKKVDGTIISLPVQDQLACFTGLAAISKAQARTTYSWAFDDEELFDNCAGLFGSCDAARKAYVIKKFTPVAKVAGLERVLGYTGMCDTCKTQANKLQNVGRCLFWEQLPTLFGLPSWEDLAKEREEQFVILSPHYFGLLMNSYRL